MHKLFLALAAAAIFGNAAPAALAQAKTPLAFVTNSPSDYWTICQKGTEAAAKHLGTVSVQFMQPPDGTAATQKSEIDDLLAAGVKGIAVAPVDPANETPYLNTVAAQANLITTDSDAPQASLLCRHRQPRGRRHSRAAAPKSSAARWAGDAVCGPRQCPERTGADRRYAGRPARLPRSDSRRPHR